MYSLLISAYANAARFASPFHRKAQLMCQGQRETPGILRKQRDPEARYIWFHAASLGEFEQGRPLIEQIKAARPEYKILLTFFSPSGYEVRKNYPLADIVCYLPFDTPGRVREFLDLARPSMAIFIKYEFWQNYLTELRRRSIPTYIISAIFRPSQPFFHWYGLSYRKVLHCFTHLFVQDDESAQLLKQYGISRNVTVTGDTRYDRVWAIRKAAKDIPEAQTFVAPREGQTFLTLVAGSSWPADETFLLRYFNEHPKLKLIIAPHEIHEEHLQGIEAQLRRPFIRFSQAQGKDLAAYDCLIIDCFGLLSSIYRYGEIAYIGGGFGAGIHNTLEAAVYGIPVIFGPKYRKFKEACDLVRLKGGFPVRCFEEFQTTLDELLNHPDLRQQAGFDADRLVLQNIGATGQILKALNL